MRLMRFATLRFLLGTLVGFSGICAGSNPPKSGCVAFSDAAKHVGTSECVAGTVLRVENGGKGVTFLSFCKEAKACPFTVVVFPADIKKMGDIRQLEGKQIEIRGTIQDYDVEREGHNSAGKFVRPKVKKTTKKEGDPISIEDPSEPQ